MVSLVVSVDQVVDNIVRYHGDPSSMVELMGMTRAWYATQVNGEWWFGPSKFVGYAGMTAEAYLASEYEPEKHGRVAEGGAVMDGRVTEGVIRRWAEAISPGHPLYRELSDALHVFCAKYGKKPNSRARLSIVSSKTAEPTPDADGASMVPLLVAAFERLTPDEKREFARATRMKPV